MRWRPDRMTPGDGALLLLFVAALLVLNEGLSHDHQAAVVVLVVVIALVLLKALRGRR